MKHLPRFLIVGYVTNCGSGLDTQRSIQEGCKNLPQTASSFDHGTINVRPITAA